MDKRTQKIIEKCHKLINKGYSLNYCLDRFKKQKKQIKDYFATVEHISSLKNIMPGRVFIENSLRTIKARAEAQKIAAGSMVSSRKKLILKPAMIFLIFFLVSVFSFAGTLFASQDSIPGQTLYPLKRSFEDFRLTVYPESLKDDLNLQFLDNRILEAEKLIDRNAGEVVVENLLVEIEDQYRKCMRYGYIDSHNKDKFLNSIQQVENHYQKRYGNGKNDAGQGGENMSGSSGNNNGKGGRGKN